ncbi:MAG: type VI secretion system ATPase TssH, partial [Patescibacteria group bacterium]
SEQERGLNMKHVSEELKKKLVDYFKPELLNRFSDIIVFKNLSPEDIQKIAAIHLTDLANQVREAQGMDLEFDDSAVKKIAELGYDPVFGARPLRNVISDRIKATLAEKILKGEVQKGGKIKIKYENEAFRFS